MNKRKRVMMRAILKGALLTLGIVLVAWAGSPCLAGGPGQGDAVELVTNGDFSASLDGWADLTAHFNGDAYTGEGGVFLVDDGAFTSAMKLTGLDDSNYNIRVEQETAVPPLLDYVEVSFDWKVTERDYSLGVNYVTVDFRDATGAAIGRVIYFDTFRQSYNLEYFRQWREEVPPGAFHGVRVSTGSFDWRHELVSTEDLPALDMAQVQSIWVRVDVQNDSGRGGEMLVDNVSLMAYLAPDCNYNGIADEEDIAEGRSLDCNENGIPDECELPGHEFLDNGAFDFELDGWDDLTAHFNGSAYTGNGGVFFVDDGPFPSAMQLTGLDDRNYNIRVEQEIPVHALLDSVLISFDWKVTARDPLHGVNYVTMDFRDQSGVAIGRVIFFDTFKQSYNLEYFRKWRQEVAPGAYHGVRVSESNFDWRHESVSTMQLPALNMAQVRSIWVRVDVQNDSGFGGEMLVDNISVQGAIASDCNGNFVSDLDDIVGGTSFDCDGNCVPDECELASEACPYLVGDVSNDGVIDSNDFLQFFTVFLGLNQCECSVAAADANRDGVLDQRDIRPFVDIIQCHLGTDVRWPVNMSAYTMFMIMADELDIELDLGALMAAELQDGAGASMTKPVKSSTPAIQQSSIPQ